jgi:hypothetical protein
MVITPIDSSSPINPLAQGWNSWDAQQGMTMPQMVPSSGMPMKNGNGCSCKRNCGGSKSGVSLQSMMPLMNRWGYTLIG